MYFSQSGCLVTIWFILFAVHQNGTHDINVGLNGLVFII